MDTKKIEKMEYEAPVTNVYELISEGCILSGSNTGANITDISGGVTIVTRTSEFNSVSSERGF